MALRVQLMTSNFKPVLLLCLVFFAGIAVGVIGTRAVTMHLFRNRMVPGLIAGEMEKKLSRELALTPEQSEKVHKIFEESQRELQELRKDLGPRFGAVFAKAEKQIAAVLTEEQKPKYEQLLKEKKAQWRPPGGPGGTPRPFPDGRPRFGDRERPPRDGTNSNLQPRPEPPSSR